MPGAREFLDELRGRFQVVILSDTFYEFARPLMEQLGRPTLFCHRLEVDEAGFVRGYRLRMPDQKRAAVNAFRALNFGVIAAGDSYNDTAMLGAAHAGIFFRPPANVTGEFPQFPVTRDYERAHGRHPRGEREDLRRAIAPSRPPRNAPSGRPGIFFGVQLTHRTASRQG